MIPWELWQNTGVLEPLDRRLGELLLRLEPGGQEVALAGAFASRALWDGDTALDLSDRLERGWTDAEGDPVAFAWPTLGAWSEALAASRLVSPDGATTPLVYRDGKVSLSRYALHERSVAEALLRVAGHPQVPANPGSVEASVARLFEGRATTSDDQMRAVREAMNLGLVVLVGGPGSGKTTTVVRLLATWMEDAAAAGRAIPRVMLLAPTGKAAARLGESIREQAGGLHLDPVSASRVLAALPMEGRTLHRALGAGSDWTTRVRHDAQSPWSADIVVVDEASMLDLALAARMLAALKPGARLVLLGDPDQLASVGVGAVLADLVSPSAPSVLHPHVLRLTGRHRYGKGGQVGRLAEAIHRADGSGVFQVMAEGGSATWEPRRGSLSRDAAFVARLVEGWRPFCEARTPVDRLAALNRFRVLCATRVGPSGVVALVAAIERALAAAGLVVADDPWYDGRPILVVANDPASKLSNGDVGVVCHASDGTVRVWFPDVDAVTGAATVRAVLPGRLPEHETVYAMTVHKSQGSQFEHVVVALPDRVGRTLGRELLYTAVTRAQERVEVVGPEEVVRMCVDRPVVRTTGLVQALGRAAP